MIALIDIGGTNTRLATSSDHKSLGQPVTIPTPTDFSEAISTYSHTINELTDNHSVQLAVVGAPGPLTKDHSRIASAPNLVSWHNQPLKEKLEQAFDAQVHIQNDADLAGLGEATCGAGQDYSIVAYLTISTGIGGARIVDQQIDRNSLGFEPGWQIIDADGTLCPDCQSPGYLEHLVGGQKLEQRLGLKPENIKDPGVWKQLTHWLALGLNNILVFWSPDVIVLGGPMMRDIDINKVARELQNISSFLPKIPPLLPAQLDETRALTGALVYSNQIN